MKHTLSCIFLYCSLLVSSLLSAQVNRKDSLLLLVNNEKTDTGRISLLHKLAKEMSYDQPDSAFLLNNRALELSQRIDFKKGIGTSHHQLAALHENKGEFPAALKKYDQALEIWETLERSAISEKERAGIKYLKLKTLTNRGNVHTMQGEFPKALKSSLEALKLANELGDKYLQANNLASTGSIFNRQKEYDKALEYYFKALKIYEELKMKNGVAYCYIGIGNTYNDKEDFKNALEYYFRSLKINEETGNKSYIAANLGNIGSAFSRQGEYVQALEYFLKALKIDEEQGNYIGMAYRMNSIGSLYLKEKKYKAAEDYLLQGLALADKIGSKNLQQDSHRELSELYSVQRDFQSSLKHYKAYAAIKDSLFNEEKNNELTRYELNYEFEKKEAAIKAEQEIKDRVFAAERSRQEVFLFLLVLLVIAVAVIAVVIFRGLQKSRRAKALIEQQRDEISVQKEIVEKQKNLVEAHQKEIIDSITYAKRLQEAILPPGSFVKEYLPDSFIYYQPKDIVAGDFYWMEVLGDTIYIAAADCTGHGVPGALVSIVCSNALNRAVKEFGLMDTGAILDKVTGLVLETFEKSGSDVKDGMDISLLAIDRKNMQIQWSGANNPLWYITLDEATDIKEIKANKQPVGKYEHQQPFRTHHLSYEAGSVFYLFTDGYADQFGGSKGKKFKYSQLKRLFLEIFPKPLEDQKEVLAETFERWKGDLQQIDDVCILAFRL